METKHCDVLIIGAGPAGYVCGIRAGQLGLDTIVLENAKAGGTCLNVGCIPSKALIHAADEFHKIAHESAIGITSGPPEIDLMKTQSWKDGIVSGLTKGVEGLLKKAKTQFITARAEILDGKTVFAETPSGPLRITCNNLILATGSRPAELPFLPFGGDVISSTQALSMFSLPKRFAIVGGGYIGLEIGTAMAKLGVDVTIVEAADRVLPQYDAALTKPVTARLKELAITLHLGAKAKGRDETGALVVDASGKEVIIPADKIMVTIGRSPNTQGFGLEGLGLTMSGSHIVVDDVCASSMRGVFAIGDITGDPMLAHRAMAQGVIVAEHITGQHSKWDKRAMPAVCFTDPEIVVVGDLPGDERATALFPFAANGRAMTMERTDGFVRVVYDPQTELIHGFQAVGTGASELVGEFTLAIEMCATLRDVADTIHAHPTLGEASQEVAHMALGHGLHI